ncbi:MAG: hypothetical protein GX344_00880 [Intrasporangiaceae bacterium]|nr:hypothetical protein [Intrasporangiaceae bacterium]
MGNRTVEAVGQGLLMAVIMIVIRRLGTTFTSFFAQESFTESAVFAVLFGIAWGVLQWFLAGRRRRSAPPES